VEYKLRKKQDIEKLYARSFNLFILSIF